MLSDTSAVITLNGSPITNVAKLVTAGSAYYYEFNSQATNVIISDKPIQVVQYAVTQGNKIDGTADKKATVGDPEMIYLNSLEQNINHVTLYSTDKYSITQSYINVVIPTAAVPSFFTSVASI